MACRFDVKLRPENEGGLRNKMVNGRVGKSGYRARLLRHREEVESFERLGGDNQ